MTQPQHDTITTSLRINRALWSRIRMRCLGESKTVNALVVDLLREWEARTPQRVPRDTSRVIAMGVHDALEPAGLHELSYSQDEG